MAPAMPGAPASPFGPAGSWPALKSAARRDPSFTLRPVTAFFLICGAPTELLGKTILEAARPSGVEPRTATTSAVTATMVLSFDLDISEFLPFRVGVTSLARGRSR